MTKSQKLFWFDTETTGRDFSIHEIIELSCIIEIDGEIKEKMTWYPKPDNDPSLWSKEALELNRTTEQELLNRTLTQKQFLTELIVLLKKYVDNKDKYDFFNPAGHNVIFDVNFLKALFLKYFHNNEIYNSFFDYHNLDTAIIGIMAHYLNKNYNAPFYGLFSTAKNFGFEKDSNKEHTSIYDIELSRNLFRKAIGVEDENK